LRDLANLLANMENSFVHGGYAETMTTYDGSLNRFDTDGLVSKHSAAIVVRAVAHKAYFAMVAFWFMANERRLASLGARILQAQAALESSTEYTG
jgi:hypothetical protein